MFLELLKWLVKLISGVSYAPSKDPFLSKIIRAYERNTYPIDKNNGEINIVYVKGVNLDGSKNDDKPGNWNDLRLVFSYEGGIPKVLGKWVATVDPGIYYVRNRINAGGAAQIAFGYHRGAWQVGLHHNDHEALVQTGGPVTVYRDDNEDFRRDGDKTDTGYFGINQHWGYDLPTPDKASAGCLVGQSKQGHMEFMDSIKSDPRYKLNNKFRFSTTVLESKEVL